MPLFSEDQASFASLFGTNLASAPPGAHERLLYACILPSLGFIPPLLLSYGVSVLILRTYTNWRGLKLEKLAGQLSMYPPFLFLIWYSHATLLDHRFWKLDNYGLRQESSASECDLFANLYIACNIVQAIGQIKTERPPLLYQLMAHHALSIWCCASAFYFDRFRWWTAFAGVCELTNLFLIPVFACKEYFPQWKIQTWYHRNCRGLYWTFVSHRLVLFPCWLSLWMHDRWKAAKDKTLGPIHWMEGVIYPLTVLGLFALSSIWFAMIASGTKKQQDAYREARKAKEA